MDEDRKKQLDGQLQLIQENLGQHPECEVTYFQQNVKKDCGSYVTAHERIKKVDGYGRRIIFTDGTAIPIEHIFSIQGRMFQRTWGYQTCRHERCHSCEK